MKSGRIETVVGVFVLIGLACVAYLTVKLGKMEWLTSDTYALSAKFSSVSGLKEGADVEIAGVLVGKVGKITLDRDNMVAKLTMNIENGIKLDDETIALVKTSGLIGDKYILLQPGGGAKTLKNGDEITQTQSSVDVEDLVGKYAFGDTKSSSKEQGEK